MIRKYSATKRYWVVVSIFVASAQYAVEIYTEGLAEPLLSAVISAHATAVKSEANSDPAEGSNAWGELGMLLQAHNLYEQTIVAYGEAIRLKRDPRWFYLRGIANGELGLVQNAATDYAEATRIEPDIAIIWYRLGNSLLSLGQVSDAHQALVFSLELDPTLAIAYMTLADVQAAASDHAGAKTLLTRAVELAPEAGQIIYRMAQVERELGNLDSSRSWLLKQTNQFAPSIDDSLLAKVAQYSLNPTFFVSAARRAWERGDGETAVAAYGRAVELDPADIDNLLGFARLLTTLKRFVEAERILDTAEYVVPNSETLWYLRAVVYAQQEQFEIAQRAIQKSIEIKPEAQSIELERQIDWLLNQRSGGD